ncbi:MAG: Metal dependent phosphohydrolase, HD region [uncultured Solirubrobacterales bacterium]|uniref:Metal dependent phosphohydrolase, HD region n=1 Tax=uncultured Solirubrobacterales bacterium TaxID=768556 RepID=A0A6J4SHZ7_9ACTN|nr:MAG: Metal dependent phosphohydrolase, HD region [uncultured Solirubrobacterales bacterium]
MKSRLLGLLLPLLVLVALLAAALLILIPGITGSGAIVTPAEAIVLLILTVLAAGLVGVAWWRERRQRERALAARADLEGAQERVDERERAIEERDEKLRERDERLRQRDEQLSETEERARGLGEQVDREQQSSRQLEEARAADRSYVRELKNEMSRVSTERGPLGRTDDVPQLILSLATSLLEAEKGLLLSRQDRDNDGDFDLLAAEGFGEDPEHSPLAQRFAKQVIERDTTLREDAPAGGGDEGADHAADQEIHNLVAVPFYVRDDFDGVVVCANRDGGFEELDDETLVALGDQAGSLLDNARLRGELRGAYVSTVSLLTEALEAKDPFLRGHSEEVSDYVAAVAEELNMPENERENLVFASLLHDVGKIGISERILLKPTALTPDERSVIELHPRIGSRLVEQVPALRPLAQTILHHHERWDGTGYPSRLTGPQIPIEARIVSVADCFSAMTAERPYRGRMPVEDACREVEACAGTQFDPTVAAAFVAAVRRRPPVPQEGLAAALDDPEIRERRGDREPLLGFGSISVTDSVTLLYSHGYFRQVVDAEATRAEIQGRAFSVVLVELIGLEEENRRSGFPAGDAALSAAGRTLQRVAVLHGGTAARHSGDRLALALPGADLDTALRLAEEVIGGLPTSLRARGGVGQWQPGDTGDDVVARARGALAGEPSRQPAGPRG